MIRILISGAILFFLFAPLSLAEQNTLPEEKSTTLKKSIDSLMEASLTKDVDPPERQEYVEVYGESYPGLNITLPSPSSLLYVPKPPGIQWQGLSEDLRYYLAVDQPYSSWARPNRGRLISVAVPTETE